MNIKTNEQKMLNKFEGSKAVLDFLNPDNLPYTPLVEIPEDLNPYYQDGVRIFAKLMNVLPLANIKSLPAYNMLVDGEYTTDTIIENSSGNTVFSLAVIARLMGIKHTKAIVSDEVSLGKLNILRFLGTEIILNQEPICPDPNDKESGIYKAKKWADEKNWFNPGQYDNKHNPEAHFKWTAPQIDKQTEGRVSVVSVGLGTTGSAVGLSKYFKEQNKLVDIVGVTRKVNNQIPGVRTKNLLQDIAFDWQSSIADHQQVGSKEAYKMSMNLCRLGLFVGPSSGLALCGLINYLKDKKINQKKPIIAVFVCPDSPFPYIDEYFDCLDQTDFPTIENEFLLKKSQTVNRVDEIEPVELFSKIENKEELNLIDLRNESDFLDHHIPGAKNVPFYKLDQFLNEGLNLNNIIFICYHGNTSKSAVLKSKQYGIKSFSLSGGDTKWSDLGFPREINQKCIQRFNLK